MVFNSANGYTIAQGTGGTLTLDKGVKNVAVNVTLGDHVISAPISLASTIAASTNANTSLTLSGVVSGAGGMIKTGPGTLNLNGNNTFTGAINASGGTIAFALPTSLGTGAISLNGATLKYGVGNNADISNRTITFAQDGATIDTNGNDVIWSNFVGNGGTGGLIKTGAGILSLGAANNYSGNTTIKGGVLQIDANNRLGAAASTLVFDGGTLAASASFSLDTVGDTTVQRPIQVEAAGGTINVAANTTLTVNSVLNGTGVLVKSGTGTLTLTSTASNASKSGGFTLRDGTLRLGTDISFGNGLTGFIGAGTLTLEGGTLTSANTADNTLSMGNAIDVPAGKTASIVTTNRFALGGAVSGAGTLNMSINTAVTRADFSNNWSAFTGTLNLTGTGGIRLLNNGGGFNVAGLAGTHLNAASSTLTLVAATNSGGNIFQIGALSGNGTLSNSNGGAANFQIGARNESTVFSGNFVPGTSHNQLTKVGTGTLTLNGATLHNGLTTVSGGTLLIDSVLPASVAPEPTLPARFVTVAAEGTLGGSGTITPATVINGGLRPDPTGTRGGQLTFDGVLELASTAVTQFDISGASFTGVKAGAASSVTLGGAVKFNFLGTVFNGSYQVFEIANTPTGAFAGVSVTTTTAAETALADSGSGVWSGTVGAQSYSFNVGTGVLTVTGGATAVTPGVSTLSATAGNAKVDLSWTAASGADTYTVKRALVSGGPYTNLIGNLAGTTYSDTTVTNGTTYYYVVQAKNSSSNLSGANSNEVSAIPVEGPAHTALQTWRFEQFGVYDDTGAVLAGDTEDFDGDGLANLLEYALGTNPTVANANPVTVAKSGNFLTLTYPRRSPVDAALTYTVQASSDLAAGFAAGGGTTNTVGSTSTYTDNVSVSTAGTRRFLRLSVSYTAP
jgi:autotransporter-associated beta strand protein